jgi:Xaa-Pro aminopeptidase
MLEKHTSICISVKEYQTRIENLAEHLQAKGLSGAVLFDREYILYYTGFAFIPTERPIAFAINAAGTRALFVPRLEQEHAAGSAVVDQVEVYVEYPFEPHPMQRLGALLQSLEINGDFAADHPGYPWIFGYRGPSLEQVTGRIPVNIVEHIEDQLMIKSPGELMLIKESIRWANLAHTLLQRYTRPGLTETEVSLRAQHEATMAMLDAIGPIYQAQNPFSNGIEIGYRGQIGRNASIPHALANNLTFQPGDILVTGANAPVWGYYSEVERTMVIGRPNAEQKQLFDHMLALQETAFNAMRPGLPCSEVDRLVRGYFEQHNLTHYWRHHSGHAIGLRYHESPFLDLGDQTIMQPGMVFTVEPGLYAADFGGFRHSDTVLITDDGIEILTYYPRDLESLTIPV